LQRRPQSERKLVQRARWLLDDFGTQSNGSDEPREVNPESWVSPFRGIRQVTTMLAKRRKGASHNPLTDWAVGVAWFVCAILFATLATSAIAQKHDTYEKTIVRYLSLQNQLFTGTIQSRDTSTYEPSDACLKGLSTLVAGDVTVTV
jgi:hypothetical protein